MRAPPDLKSQAAPEASRSREAKADRVGATITVEDKQTSPLAQLISDLEHMAAWREDLEARLWRARMRFEACGLPSEEQEVLTAEVRIFKNVARSLAENMPGRLVPIKEAA